MSPVPTSPLPGDAARRAADPASAPTEELRLAGRPAAPGLAAGTLFVLAGAPLPSGGAASTATPAQERAALRAALSEAVAALLGLAATVDTQAALLLEFQVSFLEDEVLAEPAFAAIEAGERADQAWRRALDAEAAGYLAAEDEYFRARAADLHDIRDRVLDLLGGTGKQQAPPAGALLLAPDLTPSRFLSVDWSGGGAIVLTGGSPTSHVAMLARARGVPMLVGTDLGGQEVQHLHGLAALLDAQHGQLVVRPQAASRLAFEAQRQRLAEHADVLEQYLRLPACTADGTRVGIQLNVADPEELAQLDVAICDGIGLVRTEFLFERYGGQPDEATQLEQYRRILAWAKGRPVTFRTLDAGGDKPIPGLTIDGESNPFLGVRGLRLSLQRPQVFRMQLRALARAGASARPGGLKIMLPMVTLPGELERARAMLHEELEALARAGMEHVRPPLGIMVEVPAAALAADTFAADFFSIGSNDLVQYVAAAGRDNAAVAELADPLQPAVLRLIEQVCRHAAAAQIELSLCGDAAADPAVIPALLRAGLRTLSMAPAAVARAKQAVSQVRLETRLG